MNRTLKALLARGFNSDQAKNLISKGYNLNLLKSSSKEELTRLGLNSELIETIYNEERPPIPEETLNSLLHKSRRTCCICRDRKRPIIIHHIIKWGISRNHNENNLVVLCVEHHDEAHTHRELSQNLTSDQIKISKAIWLKEVERLDKEGLAEEFKELNVIPKSLSKLKRNWLFF